MGNTSLVVSVVSSKVPVLRDWKKSCFFDQSSRFLVASSTSFLAFRKELLESNLFSEEVKNHNSGITNLTGGLYLK